MEQFKEYLGMDLYCLIHNTCHKYTGRPQGLVIQALFIDNTNWMEGKGIWE